MKHLIEQLEILTKNCNDWLNQAASMKDRDFITEKLMIEVMQNLAKVDKRFKEVAKRLDKENV